ncbi:hypothetical protein VSDG_05341 [Cytospora chrysosperma]|uniref:Cation/H+ exchanger transmembrane domain-containing protein n=1 Tax=Cytospora chrysosperma TaxID=252740 RepID=A0A423VWZ5_CYTCH|nr:hypothetical protein VSDG_05341 [Valsa sordida]
MWSQLEPTPSHITYLTLPFFLILFSLFSVLIRNRLHLSEPPLAVLFGILLGPALLNIFSPHEHWGVDDGFTQEFSRLVLGIQCFAFGIELPALWFTRRAHWVSILWLLGPVMTYSWAVTGLLARLVFGVRWPTAMIIGACLSPTDPVLAASVLGASRFSARVPKRLRDLLGAESACNDGASFPFLYVGLFIFQDRTAGAAWRDWVLITVLYQCVLGLLVGYAIGWVANWSLRFSEARGYISRPSLVVFYLLLAILCVGVGSTLGLDDFLVAFGAGIGFAHDGWISSKAGDVPFRSIVDLVLNSTVFVYFGSMIPWSSFVSRSTGVLQGHIGVGSLTLFLVLVLLFRRIPIVLALQAGKLIPDVKTYREALFCGHFGPMGVGALFLAIETRAQLETGTSIPLPRPKPPVGPPYDDTDVALALVWPVICFVVLGSSMVHGLSGLVISLGGHLSRRQGERAPLLGGESQGLAGMVHEEDEVGNGDSVQ